MPSVQYNSTLLIYEEETVEYEDPETGDFDSNRGGN